MIAARIRAVVATALLGIALLCAFAEPATAQRVDVIAPSGQYVTDRADLLNSAQERALNEKLRMYEDSTSTQIVIVTVPSLEGVPPEEYALAIGREWGVGQEGQDNGVVILVSRDDREVRIETGYGLEGAIPDAYAARIYRNVLVPNFREGNFYAGLSQASDYLIAAAAGEFVADEVAPEREGEGTFNAATIFVLLIIAFFVINAIRHGHHGGGSNDGGRRVRRRRGGPPIIIWGGGMGGGFGGGGGGGFGGGGFGGFSGGGGGFGGGGAGGGW